MPPPGDLAATGEPSPPTRARPRLSPRRALGLAIVLTGLALLGLDLWQLPVLQAQTARLALVGGSFAALATALGTLPVALSQPLSQRAQDTMMGFGAGVMLAATAFSLVMPGIAAAKSLGHGPWGAGGIVGAGIVLGALTLLAIERAVPHEHFDKGPEGPPSKALKRAWLFILAITLHNVPEGVAIGVGYAGNSAAAGHTLATGIAIQDVPEGLVVALALVAVGYRRSLAVAIGAASGLVEPIGAVLGALVVTMSAPMLPWGLAFAAGAMLFVVSHEIIPESHRQGHEAAATLGLVLGFVVMTLLDTALG